MSKGLRALNRIKEFLKLNTKHWKQDVDYIEEELEQAQKDKEMLNVFKNALTIEHHDYQMVELDHSKDAMSCFVKELTTIKQNELDKSMSKALREWVLKNAFPKELKALEIVKNKRVNVYTLKPYFTYIDYNDLLPNQNERQLTQEEYDLLKEVLL